MSGLAAVSLLISVCALGEAKPLVANGGFESVAEVKLGADGRVQGWRLGQPPRVPAGWSLNTAYPGELSVCDTEPGKPGAHAGQRFIRIAAPDRRSAHLYQMCPGLEAGKWYRVSAWVRGGSVTLAFYEYLKSGKIGGQTVAQAIAAGDQWKRIEGFYRPPAEGYLRSALAISTSSPQPVDVDDVAIEALALPETPAAGADLTFETTTFRLTVSSHGLLREFRDKASGKDYAVGSTPFPILRMTHRGMMTPLHSLTRDGDLLRAQFLDPELRASLRVTPRQQHLLFEVVSVQPADAEGLNLEFPMRRLKTVAGAFNATYDDQFGACLLGTTVNVDQRMATHGSDIVGLGARCTGKHGMVGARLALAAAPWKEFKAAIMEAERANGLPCPMLEGQWARDSQPVRRSYLFVVDAKESNIDQMIEYAKIGHFGMIIFLKGNWLANHGHYAINTTNFPDGLASLKRAVAKIHAAGMGAGVHVFGPSISPNDPYVTPKPDDRLAAVACPPLAEAVDAKSTALTLAGVPPLPPKAPRSDAFPGYHLRIGDEIIRYQEIESGPQARFVRCQRGALGTKPSPHPAGAEVKGLLTMWGYFLVDPHSTLADELTANFASVFNACDFDMIYFDASDGINDAYLDRWYYLNKMHLGFYRKLKKDVLYQTSNGTGSGLVWHIVPRSASADGHGDLKKYLDERLAGMLGMAANFTRADVGWYYMYNDVRPDQIEYVCAKTIGLDGSISIETSQASMEKHPRARQMIEMVGRYEQCRLASYFPESVKAELREPGKDFKLLGDRAAWKLYRAVYEEPRFVEAIDGRQNVWTVKNELSVPCPLGVEIACGFRSMPTSGYDQAGAITVESFDDASPYQRSEGDRMERFLGGPEAMPIASGAARAGVSASLVSSAEGAKVGPRCAVFTATNKGPRGGWCATGRRLPKPLDLSRCQALGLWVDGDGKGETLRVQLRDAAGRAATWPVLISFQGWRLCVFRKAEAAGFDWSKTECLVARIEGMAGGVSVRVGLDDLRALPELHPMPALAQPTVQVNGRSLQFPLQLQSGQALTSAGPGGVEFWPGGMQAGQRVAVSTEVLMLQPGENRVTFSADPAQPYPGDVNVLLNRLWPMEK